jgi:hypothetical protein
MPCGLGDVFEDRFVHVWDVFEATNLYWWEYHLEDRRGSVSARGEMRNDPEQSFSLGNWSERLFVCVRPQIQSNMTTNKSLARNWEDSHVIASEWIFGRTNFFDPSGQS